MSSPKPVLFSEFLLYNASKPATFLPDTTAVVMLSFVMVIESQLNGKGLKEFED